MWATKYGREKGNQPELVGEGWNSFRGERDNKTTYNNGTRELGGIPPHFMKNRPTKVLGWQTLSSQEKKGQVSTIWP